MKKLAVLLFMFGVSLAILLLGQGIPFPGPATVVGTPPACGTLVDSNTATATIGSTPGAYSGDAYSATAFQASSSYTVCEVDLQMSIAGSPTKQMVATIYTDNSGVPGTVVGTGSANYPMSSLGAGAGDTYFTGMSAALTSGTVYWIVVSTTGGQNPNYANWYEATVDTYNSYHGSNGTSWSKVGNFDSSFKTYK